MSDNADDKSIDPTPHRRQQAREEGHVARSHDLASAGMLLLGLVVLVALGGGLVAFLLNYLRSQLGGEPVLTIDADSTVSQWNATLWALSRYLLPILGLLCLAGVAVNVLQVGFLFLPQKLAFDPSRLSPIRGWQRVFSANSTVHLGFAIFKLLVVFSVAAIVLYNQREALLGLVALAPPQLAVQMTQLILWTALKIGGALLILAVLDYGYQRWRYEQDLKMTPQELRDDMKNLEGDPQLAARRKQTQRDMAVARISDVAESPVETQADGLKRHS
jgi:flagellar biosynthesis protein FlhB